MIRDLFIKKKELLCEEKSLFTIKNELIPKHKVERKRIALELLSIDNPEFNKISAN